MRALLAAALAVVLAHVLLSGSSADLGPTLEPAAQGMVLCGIGLGLLTRGPTGVIAAVLLALLCLLRGTLCDVLGSVTPGSSASALGVAALTLLPPSVLLGRILRGGLRGSFTVLLVGLCAGVLLVRLGAAGWFPASLGLPLCVFVLVWSSRHADGAKPVVDPASPARSLPLPAFFIGGALGLVALSVGRMVPAYVLPSASPAGDVALALLLPAAIVAWPASVLGDSGWSLRLLGAAGGLLVTAAVWITANNLGLYENATSLVDLTRRLHDYAARTRGWLSDWDAWLLSYAGYAAAAFGVACGALRGARAAGLALLGAGFAQLAEHALLSPESPLDADSVRAPMRLLLAAASLGAMSAFLALFGRRGWWALPVVLLPFLDWRVESGAPYVNLEAWRSVPGFDEVRRPGEYSVEVFRRELLGDVTLFSTPGPDSHALEGREAYTTTLSPREPLFSLGADGSFESPLLEPATHGEPPDVDIDPDAPPSEPQPPSPAEVPRRFFGVRVAGRPLHAQHMPLGVEGSVGRLTRLFAVPGRMFVCGVGAELLAADLQDSGLARGGVVASQVPLGQRLLHVLLDHLGSAGWQAAEVRDPVMAARAARPASFETVVVAPASEAFPGTTALLTEEFFGLLENLLAPGGRCLVWLDTTELDARALRARMAAFGARFSVAEAFVEPRELDPPFVLLMGVADPPGGVDHGDLLQARLPFPDTTGFRTRLRNAADLSALLLRDAKGMADAASDGPRHARARPVESRWGAETGWAAVASVADPRATLSSAAREGQPPPASAPAEEFAGLAQHSRYRYRLAGLNDTLLEIKPDVNWSVFDEEAAHYARAAAADPQDPVLHLALAALLEQLAAVGDYSRFVRVYEDCRAGDMHCWRLALQEAWVRKQGLDERASAEAVERARRWAAGE